MNRKLLYLSLLFLTGQLTSRGQTPGYVLNSEQQAIHLDTTDGRKLLIVILPLQPDTALVGQLVRFQQRHSQQLRIFGILPAGTGVLTGASAQNGYGNLPGTGITLTQGIGDTDSVAGPRGALLKYLSRKSRNRQVDRFAEGSKYFLSEQGRLFAQLDKAGSLDSRVADYIVQTIVPGATRF